MDIKSQLTKANAEINQDKSEETQWEIDSGVGSGMSSPAFREDRYILSPEIMTKELYQFDDQPRANIKNCEERNGHLEDPLSLKQNIIDGLQVKN